jgi:hypothetical protein
MTRRHTITVRSLLVVAASGASLACIAEDAELRSKSELQLEASSGASEAVVAEEATEIFGALASSSKSPRNAALAYIKKNAAALRIVSQDLTSALPPGREVPAAVPLFFQASTGEYKFTRLSFGQARAGIPVHGVRVDVLVRNEAGNPIVSVSSDALELGDFEPRVGGKATNAESARAFLRKNAGAFDYSAQLKVKLGLKNALLDDADPVIWAGSRSQRETPRLAASFIASSKSGPERFRVVADANTGNIISAENLVVHEVAEGSVSGVGTPGNRAMDCTDSVSIGMVDASILYDGNEVFTDVDGSFSFDHPATESFELTSPVSGRYFVVAGPRGGNETLVESVLTPQSIDFVHDADDSEFRRAQVNGYVDSNHVRSWLLGIHPDFPTIATQERFPVNVNLSTSFCPGNAWYDGVSINSCRSSDEYANTSFSSVTQHEYGHHIVEMAGSGQGAYGEGMADVIAVLIADDPGLGLGFFRNECDTPLRNADNECRYLPRACSTCGSEVHACGNLISGIVWDMRQAFGDSLGEEGLAYVSNLAINSTLLHRGTGIGWALPSHFLTLDDDDADIGNGTPHRAEICGAFEGHGIPCPELQLGLSVGPRTAMEFSGEREGPFEPAELSYTLTNQGPGSISYTVSSSASWLSIDGAEGTLAEEASVAVHFAIDASQLEGLNNGTHTAEVTFVDESGLASDRVLPVTLSLGSPEIAYSWDMSVDPGWAREGSWAFGIPAGLGGDPSSAATGDNVLGFNLNGVYLNNRPALHLITEALDCSNLRETRLSYQRWLGVESNSFDNASIEISTDSIEWTTVWQNGSADLIESAWSQQVVDIAAIADGNATVYLRWTMGRTDGSVQFGGWNIDDVSISGFSDAL